MKFSVTRYPVRGDEGTTKVDGKPGMFAMLQACTSWTSHCQPFILPIGRNSATVFVIPAISIDSFLIVTTSTLLGLDLPFQDTGDNPWRQVMLVGAALHSCPSNRGKGLLTWTRQFFLDIYGSVEVRYSCHGPVQGGTGL